MPDKEATARIKINKHEELRREVVKLRRVRVKAGRSLAGRGA